MDFLADHFVEQVKGRRSRPAAVGYILNPVAVLSPRLLLVYVLPLVHIDGKQPEKCDDQLSVVVSVLRHTVK